MVSEAELGGSSGGMLSSSVSACAVVSGGLSCCSCSDSEVVFSKISLPSLLLVFWSGSFSRAFAMLVAGDCVAGSSADHRMISASAQVLISPLFSLTYQRGVVKRDGAAGPVTVAVRN